VSSLFTAENAEGAEKKENQISGVILDAAICRAHCVRPRIAGERLPGMFGVRINEPQPEGPNASSSANKVPWYLR
jgi:hypothetical protein